MKKIIVFAACTALTLGCFTGGISANEAVYAAVDTVTEAPTDAVVVEEAVAEIKPTVVFDELDALLTAYKIPYTTQQLIEGIVASELTPEQIIGFFGLTAESASAKLLLSQLEEYVARYLELLEEALVEAVRPKFVPTQAEPSPYNLNYAIGDSNLNRTELAELAFAGQRGVVHVDAYDGITSSAINKALEDEALAAIFDENCKNAGRVLINVGGNDYLNALSEALLSATDPETDLNALIASVIAETTENVTTELSSVISRMLELKPTLNIVICGIPEIDLAALAANAGIELEGVALDSSMFDAVNSALAQSLEQGENVEFLDVNEQLESVEAPFAEDGIHYTDDAVTAISTAAARLYKSMKLRVFTPLLITTLG